MQLSLAQLSPSLFCIYFPISQALLAYMQTCVLYTSPMWHMGSGPILYIGPDLFSTTGKQANPTDAFKVVSCYVLKSPDNMKLWLHDRVGSKKQCRRILQNFTFQLYKIICCTDYLLYPLIKSPPFFVNVWLRFQLIFITFAHMYQHIYHC